MIYAACAATLVACPSNPRETEKSQKRVDLAKDLLAQGQDAAAESEGKKAVAFDARNEEAHQILGKIFIVRANRNVGLIEREGCLEGTVADGLRAEANADMRRADEYLARAVELAPDLGEAWMDRSVIAIYFQDWDKAIEYGQKALAGLAKLQNEALARAGPTSSGATSRAPRRSSCRRRSASSASAWATTASARSCSSRRSTRTRRSGWRRSSIPRRARSSSSST